MLVKLNIVFKAGINNLITVKAWKCVAEKKKGTNLGPRHIRQNWFDHHHHPSCATVHTGGKFDQMALWEMSVYYMSLCGEAGIRGEVLYSSFITASQNWIQTCSL